MEFGFGGLEEGRWVLMLSNLWQLVALPGSFCLSPVQCHRPVSGNTKIAVRVFDLASGVGSLHAHACWLYLSSTTNKPWRCLTNNLRYLTQA